jgi:hypothetical protein
LPTWQQRRGWRSDAGQVVDFSTVFSVAVLDLSAYVSNLRVSLVRADITKLEWAGLNERADVEAAFRTLVDRDWLAEPEAGSGARGGRPSATYIINPKVHLTSGCDHG